MAVSNKAIIPAKAAENSQTTQYTVPSLTTTVIDKFTVTNTTASSANFTVNIVTSGDVASSANRIFGARAIAAGETFDIVSLVGQVLEAGSFISTLAGTAAALTIRASGREIT